LLTSFKFLTLLSVLSLIFILFSDLCLGHYYALSVNIDKLMKILYQLCMAYLGSYIFYYFVVYLKEKNDRIIVEPYISKQIQTIIHSGKVLIHYFEEATNNKLKSEYPTQNELDDICKQINPNNIVKGWHNANWLMIFQDYATKSKQLSIGTPNENRKNTV